MPMIAAMKPWIGVAECAYAAPHFPGNDSWWATFHSRRPRERAGAHSIPTGDVDDNTRRNAWILETGNSERSAQ
jgi:hypothetical protein